MKKLSKRILALMMAAIMAMPVMLVMPFSASADEASSKIKLAWDFTNGVNIQNDGSEYHPASYGDAKLRMIHYGSNTFSYQYGGLRTADGFVYIENLSDYLEADKDISIKFTLDIGDKIDANHGVFGVGSELGTDKGGDQGFNDVVYMKNDGTLNYRGGGSTESILTGSKTSLSTSTNYTFEIYFDNSAKKITVYKDNEIIGEKTDSANLTTSDFNFLGIGVWQYTYYGNFCLKSIEISQPDTGDYSAVAKANYNNAAKQSINASTGIRFTGSDAGAVTQNVIYPNAAGSVESAWQTIDNSGNSNTRMSYKFFYPASSFGYLYEGNKAVIKIPVILEVDFNGGEIKGYAFNYIASTNADWTLEGNWCKCTSASNWTQTASGSVNDLTVISTDSSHDHTDFTKKNGGNATQQTSRDTIYLSNTLVYNGAIDNSSYLTTITSKPSFIFSEDCYGYSDGVWGMGAWNGEYNNKTCELSFGDITVKALNYALMAAAVDSINAPAFQTAFENVAANEWMYTDASLAAYYKGVGKVASFDLNDFDLTYGGMNAAASEMKSAVDAFNAINLEKNTFTVEFKTSDGNSTIASRSITAGDPIGAPPANTAKTHIADTETHYAYSWNGLTGNEVVHEDTVYTETATVENCSFGEGVHTAATTTANGYTTYTCACGNSYVVNDDVADLTALRNAYNEADAILKSLVGKAAEYDAASVQTLIEATEVYDVAAYLNAADASVFNKDVHQETVNGLKDDILAAIAGLTLSVPAATEEEMEVYEAAVEKINNLDPDAYESVENSIETGISNANAVMENGTAIYGGQTINVVNTSASAQDIEDAVNTILSALTSSVKKYTITLDGVNVAGANNGTYEDGKATYGTKMTFVAADSEAAWFMEVTTATTHRSEQFQGYGEVFKTSVIGNLKVTAVSKTTDNNCQVKVVRDYGDGRNPVMYVDYVESGTDYTLPTNTAIPFFDFNGYFDGETPLGSSVTITEDTVITAKYTKNDEAAYTITYNEASTTAAYNDKIDLIGADDTYAWVEQTAAGWRPFSIGKDVSFFATETTTLKSVDKNEFDSYNFALPTVNLRKDGTITSGTKVIFNGQLVAGNANVVEYGVLVGVAGEVTPTADDVVVEKSGAQDGYKVVRAKATKPVGANQFAIAINGLAGKTYIYKGYVIYKDASGNLQTVYTE